MNIIVTDNITFMNKDIADYNFEQNETPVSVIIFSSQDGTSMDKKAAVSEDDHLYINNGKKYVGDIDDLVKSTSHEILSFDYSYSNDCIEYDKLRSACIAIKKISNLKTVIFIVNQWQLSDAANFITSQMYILPIVFDEKYFRNLVKDQKSTIRNMKYFRGRTHNPIILSGYRCFKKIKNTLKRILF